MPAPTPTQRTDSVSTDAPAPGIAPDEGLPLGSPVLLQSGAAASVVELATSTLVAIEWRAALGSVQDGPVRGASQWVAATLTRRLRAKQPLGKEFGAVGAEVRAHSDVEHLIVRVHAPAQHAKVVVELLERFVRAPSAAELSQSRRFAQRRMRAQLASADLTARAALLRELFELPTERHPYANLLAPTRTLDGASAQKVAALASRGLDPKQARVVIAGAVQAAALGSTTAAPRSVPKPARVPSPLQPTALRIVLVDHPGAARAVGILGTLGPATDDPRAALARAAWFAIEDWGNRRATWAGQRFRNGPELLAWSVSAAPPELTAWANAVLSKRPGRSPKWLAARVRAADAPLLELDSAVGVARSHGELLGAGLDPLSFDADRGRARRAPVAALDAALATHLARKTWVLSVAGDAKSLAPSLQRFAPVSVHDPASDFSIQKQLPRTQAAGAH